MTKLLISKLLYNAKQYMKHGHKCLHQPWFDGNKECTCGLEELLTEIEKYK